MERVFNKGMINMVQQAKVSKAQAVKALERLGWTNIHTSRPRSGSVYATSPNGKVCLVDPRDLLKELQEASK